MSADCQDRQITTDLPASRDRGAGHGGVEQAEGAVILRGRVESFYHKQLAQELIRTAIDGVEVINAIQVVYSRERSLTASDFYTP